MTLPRDPDGVEPTLLPGTPAHTPAETDTPSQPGATDVTLAGPAPSLTVRPADPSATLPSVARPAPGHETNGEVEATLLPTSTDTGTDATGADLGATLPAPVSRTVVAGGSAGSLGSDTSPASASSLAGGRLGASPSATGTMVGRFALKGLHASGGLGEVFTARDTELNREVAVKRIKSRYADDPGSRRRFLTEAELTARLDHPGVVPVFGLVNDVRGRPCYAMRFIRGETLKDEIDRYHGIQKPEDREQKTEKTEKMEETAGKPAEAKPEAVPVPASDAVPRSVAFRHLLARFIATCQAIGYAHARKIIHRDIKPANIMVGTFGETLVVDWGLAKSLDDGPDFDRMMQAAADAGFRHDPEATDLPSHMTMAGTAVGTPAYMAPEQAAGQVDKVGPRADIYSLGATLFAILTGKAPFSGKTTAEVLDRVRRGDYEPAATVNPDSPKPLDAIARKAMALRPEDRYATALELSADVERWLSDEPVSCYRDPLLARLARWARRHPARIAAAGSLLLAGILGAAGIAWAIHEGRKDTLAALEKVTAEEKKKNDALEALKAAQNLTLAANIELSQKNQIITDEKQKVEVARNVARDRYEKAVAAYNILIGDLDKKLATRAGMQDIRKTLLLNSTEGLKQLIAGGGANAGAADRTLVAAYRQMGEVYQLIGETGPARENFTHAVETARLVQRGATTPADKRAADRDLGRSLQKLAGICLQAGDTTTALARINEAVELFTALAADKNDTEAPGELAAAKSLRAAILTARGQTGKALIDCNEAVAACRQRVEAAPTNLERKRAFAASLDALAALQLRTGHTAEALASAQKSLTVRDEIATQLPDQPDVARERAAAYGRLGDLHFERARMADATNAYRAGLKILKEWAEKDEKNATTKADLVIMYGRLANALLRTGDVEEALANAKAGKELALELQKADPDSATAQRDLASARERYGDVLLVAGRTNEGIAEYTASEKILRPLRDADKGSALAKIDLARGLERLGDGCLAKNDWFGAVAALGDSVKIREAIAADDAGSARAKRDLAIGLDKLAIALCGADRIGEAGKIATRATEMFVKLAGSDLESKQAERDVAQAYDKWGQILAAGGHATGALIVWQSSLDQSVQLAKVDDENVQAKEDEAAAWERLANFYAALGNNDRALTAARTAVNRWTAIGKGTDVRTKAGRRRLALAMLRCGDISTGIREFATARDWYAKAAAETEGFAADPLLGPIAKLIAAQQDYLDAVVAGVRNPESVLRFPAPVRAAALRTVATLELRADHPTNASVAAEQLAKIATTPAETFAAAQAFAGCAAAISITDPKVKQTYAAEAVTYLKAAVVAGWRDADALDAPEWAAVGKHNKEFAKVQAEVEKLRAGK